MKRIFGRWKELEEPDEELFIQYYHLKKKEKLEENVGKETDWTQFLSGKEWEVFNDLSDFQQNYGTFCKYRRANAYTYCIPNVE